MLVFITLYMIISHAMVAAMILTIGQILGDCPQSGPTTRSEVATIATGDVMIRTGGVALIGVDPAA